MSVNGYEKNFLIVAGSDFSFVGDLEVKREFCRNFSKRMQKFLSILFFSGKKTAFFKFFGKIFFFTIDKIYLLGYNLLSEAGRSRKRVQKPLQPITEDSMRSITKLELQYAQILHRTEK